MFVVGLFEKSEEMAVFSFSLDIHGGGKIVEGPPVKYLNGVVASSKVDPNIFNFIELLATIRDCGYGLEDNITLFYKLPNSYMNTGLVPLRSQADLVNMFAVSFGSVVTEIFVDCPNEEDENDDEDPVGTRTSGLDVLTDVGADLEVGIGLGVVIEMEIEMLKLEMKVDQVMDAGSDSDGNNLVEQEEDENGNPVYPEFKDSDLKNPQLIEGRVFRQLLREYHIKEGYAFKFIKNDSSRVTVRCAENCGFRLHASPMYGERSFQIKKINQQHECTRKYFNNNATSTWISKKYLAKISDAPKIKVKSMKKTVRRECLINVSQNQVYRAKMKALELIQGNYKEHYARL
ncbi:hypothetical protein Vadar_027340 [Vaccinium darrowii]|uniref:Uncharacterized protein n=1 Tax=Vaccinium darrowii TaxID=229202 RepID=A0ACB7Z6L2_9ERIC|nr:hypothetical protein Vadar_027340 [Vaccinium darrowii]